MKKLNSMEVEVVSGGICENMSTTECIQDIGGLVPAEVQNFFSGLNQMGRNLGSWFYDMTHC